MKVGTNFITIFKILWDIIRIAGILADFVMIIFHWGQPDVSRWSTAALLMIFSIISSPLGEYR